MGQPGDKTDLGPGPDGNPGLPGRPGPRGLGGDIGPPVSHHSFYFTTS